MARAKDALKSEYLTIAEFSEVVNRTPQTIYKKIKKKPSFSTYIRVFDGVRYIHKSAIWDVYGIRYEGYEPGFEPRSSSASDDQTALVTALTEQIKSQQQQIEGLQRNIENLVETIKNEQKLRLIADNRIEALTEQIRQQTATPEEPDQEDRTDPPEDQAASEQNKEPEPPKRPSFFERFRKAWGR